MHDAHVYYACNVVIVSELITSNTNATLSAPYCTHMYQLNKKSVFASSHIMNVFQKKKNYSSIFFYLFLCTKSQKKKYRSENAHFHQNAELYKKK